MAVLMVASAWAARLVSERIRVVAVLALARTDFARLSSIPMAREVSEDADKEFVACKPSASDIDPAIRAAKDCSES
jgi:hypothetical protein